ncbi:hypothetical protein [Bacteroides sp.]
MKRFAAHYLWSPQTGLIKQAVVEVVENCATSIFPLTEEIESVEWYPGIIVLWPYKEISPEELKQAMRQPAADNELHTLYAHLFYPFDFTMMQPVAGTQHRLLL